MNSFLIKKQTNLFIIITKAITIIILQGISLGNFFAFINIVKITKKDPKDSIIT